MNIFENAKFGDKYYTRDDRMALFIKPSSFSKKYWIVVQGKGSFLYTEDGTYNIDEHPLDIMGKWVEEVDEDELYRKANAWIEENIPSYIRSEISNTLLSEYNAYKDGYRDGFNKAMNGE